MGTSRPHHTHKAVAATGPCRGPRAAEALLVVSAVGERAVGIWILLRTLSSGALEARCLRSSDSTVLRTWNCSTCRFGNIGQEGTCRRAHELPQPAGSWHILANPPPPPPPTQPAGGHEPPRQGLQSQGEGRPGAEKGAGESIARTPQRGVRAHMGSGVPAGPSTLCSGIFPCDHSGRPQTEAAQRPAGQ